MTGKVNTANGRQKRGGPRRDQLYPNAAAIRAEVRAARKAQLETAVRPDLALAALEAAVRAAPAIDPWNPTQLLMALNDVALGTAPEAAAARRLSDQLRAVAPDIWGEYLSDLTEAGLAPTPGLDAAMARTRPPQPGEAYGGPEEPGQPPQLPQWRRVPIQGADGLWHWVPEGARVVLDDAAMSALGAPASASNMATLTSIDPEGTTWVVPDYVRAYGGLEPEDALAVPVGVMRLRLSQQTSVPTRPIEDPDDVTEWLEEFPNAKRASAAAGIALSGPTYEGDAWRARRLAGIGAAADLALREGRLDRVAAVRLAYGCAADHETVELLACISVTAQKAPATPATPGTEPEQDPAAPTSESTRWVPGPYDRPISRPLKTKVWVPDPSGAGDVAGGEFVEWRDIKKSPERMRVDPKDTRFAPPNPDRFKSLLDIEAPVERSVLPRVLRELSPVQLNELRPRGKDEVSPKKLAKESRGAKNILAIYNLATPEEKDYWANWYRQGHATAVELAKKYGTSPALAAGVIAVLSPQMKWEQNVKAAELALARNWKGLSNYQGLHDSKRKAYSLVENGDFTAVAGPKVEPFFWSLLYPERFEDRVVVDTHAANIWRGVREGETWGISDRMRSKMEQDYRDVAKAVGLTAQALQAITWIVWRRIPTGKFDAATDTAAEAADAKTPDAKTAAGSLGLREMEQWMETPGDTFGIVSAYKSSLSKSENQARHGKLMAQVQLLGYPPSKVKPVRGQYFDAAGDMVAEKAILILGADFGDILALGQMFDQESVIYKNSDGLIGAYYTDGSMRANIAPAGKPSRVEVRSPKPESGGPPAPTDPWSKSRNVGFEFPIDWSTELRYDPAQGPLRHDDVALPEALPRSA